jgi:hypothetical protein
VTDLLGEEANEFMQGRIDVVGRLWDEIDKADKGPWHIGEGDLDACPFLAIL